SSFASFFVASIRGGFPWATAMRSSSGMPRPSAKARSFINETLATVPFSIRFICSMNEQQKRFYEFGPFRLDANGHQLFQGGERLTLTRKACEVLLLMIEHSGETLSKDDFLKTIWSDRFVEEGILTVHISALRKILGEKNGGGQHIETVPRVGYRFVAQVREVIEDGKSSLSPGVLAAHEGLPGGVAPTAENPAARQVPCKGICEPAP